jgi:4-hydroxybenzoate polyprenyltransferase
MIAFLKLIRWPNILMIWVAMCLALFGVINPALSLQPFEAGLNLTEFLLLVGATTFIAVAGYLLNDVHDINPDSVNKPGKNRVGRNFAVHKVQLLYWVFTVLGILAGTYFSYLLGRVNYSLVFVLSAGLLWVYSKRYQCQPLVGNLVVAFLSALTIAIVWLFSFFALADQPDIFVSVQSFFSQANLLILIFSGFAFITSLIREIVKDMQDFKGDDRFGCRTLAVVSGVEKTKRWAMLVTVMALILALRSQVYFYHIDFRWLFWFFLLIDTLFVAVLLALAKAGSASEFKKISNLLKVLMVAGILSMTLVYLEF